MKIIEMNNTDAADNITEELSKLLRQSKEKDKKKDKEDNYDSDNEMILETPVTDVDIDEDNIKNDNDKLSSKDLINAVSDLRIDTLKILEMLTELNTEIDLIKERLNKIEQSGNKKNINNVDDMQEQIDKILSVKLDEFKLKLKKNMKIISKK